MEISAQGGRLQCGLVFATNIIIIAYFSSKIAQIAGTIRPPDYHIMKRAWESFEHKPTANILNSRRYRCYLIPYHEITHMGATETGRIRKRTFLTIHTKLRNFTFKCMVGKETLDRDVSQLLHQSGVSFSKGE
jgi:hypothetical protein